MVRKVLVLTSMTRSELRPPVPSTVPSSSSIFMRLSLSYFDLRLLVQFAKMDPLSLGDPPNHTRLPRGLDASRQQCSIFPCVLGAPVWRS
jgi:hypothetical protein